MIFFEGGNHWVSCRRLDELISALTVVALVKNSDLLDVTDLGQCVVHDIPQVEITALTLPLPVTS